MGSRTSSVAPAAMVATWTAASLYAAGSATPSQSVDAASSDAGSDADTRAGSGAGAVTRHGAGREVSLRSRRARYDRETRYQRDESGKADPAGARSL